MFSPLGEVGSSFASSFFSSLGVSFGSSLGFSSTEGFSEVGSSFVGASVGFSVELGAGVLLLGCAGVEVEPTSWFEDELFLLFDEFDEFLD